MAAHRHRLRVRYSDCDPQGVLFNANYLTYFDIAITELWREALGSYEEMHELGVDLVVAEAKIRYLAPVRFDEEVDLAVAVSKLGTTSIGTSFEVLRVTTPAERTPEHTGGGPDGRSGSELAAEGQMRHVCIALDGSGKTAIPEAVAVLTHSVRRRRRGRRLAPPPGTPRPGGIVDDAGVSEAAEHDSARSRVYVTGHKNPDMDSIASAIGYAELKGRVDLDNEYVPVRLGDVNSQTAWCLERSGAPTPDFMGHVMLRVRDVMSEEFPIARHSEPVREVGLTMSRGHLDIVPIVDDSEKLIGVMTERALAHRYIRESRKTSTLVDAPTTVKAIVEVLDGELVVGDDHPIEGRVWVHSIDPEHSESRISEGDVVVVGNRVDAQRQSLELGAAMLVASNGVKPPQEILDLAAEVGATVVVSPLDSYVSSRMITLAAPCRALADRDPLTVEPDDLLSEVADQVKDVHYRAAVAVDSSQRPIGLVTRSDLVSPTPRRVILVDHAEQGQSVTGVEEAEIVEILDHHHIGSIETHVPVTATFDPVGSTATLVVERFRQNGMEPSMPSATMLLGAVLSDTVLLNSPTTTPRDHAVVEYLERAIGDRRDAVRPRDVRGQLRRLLADRRRDRQPRREGVPARQRRDDLDRPDRDRRTLGPRAQGRAARVRLARSARTTATRWRR